MQYVAPDVSTVCVGQAASMGAFLLAAGAKGKRISLKNSRIMIHQPSGGYSGQVTDVEIHATEMRRLKHALNEMLAAHTGQPIDKLTKDAERDYFMSASEAKTYGLIDSVFSTRPTPIKAV